MKDGRFFSSVFFFTKIFGEMKYEQYTSLITKLEKYAEENPKGYELSVADFA